MIKLSIEDFIFEVKEELKSYEILGDKKAQEWEENFTKWLNNDSINKRNIKDKNDKKFYLIKDESQIFDIADKYLEAVENKEEKQYWKNFQ